MSMTTVANCPNVTEVQRLQIVLDSNGIESFIPDSNSASIAPCLFSTKSGVRLQVDEKDVERAKSLIEEARESYRDEEEQE